jgi:hypothetical protein
MNPHASEIVAEKIVQRIPRKKRKTIGDPVGLVDVIVEIRFGPLSQVADGLSSLFIGPGPNAEGNSVKGVRGVLLENKCMVDTVRLASPSADLNIVGEACLGIWLAPNDSFGIPNGSKHTFIAACRARAISLSCSSLGLLPRISGSQN